MRLGLGLGFNNRRGASFSPDMVESAPIGAWIKASDIATISDTAGAVDLIADKSGNNHHAVSTTTGRPTTGTRTVNGKNALDMTNNWLRIDDHADFDHSENGFTVIVVAQFDTENSSAFEPIAAKSGASNREWSIGNLDGTNGLYANYYETGTTSIVLDRNRLTTTAPRILYQRYAGAATKPEYGFDRTDPLMKSSVNRTIQQSTNNIWLGWFGTGASYFNGLFCEFIYYKGYLSDAELDKVGRYLSNEWGAVWATRNQTAIVCNSGQSNATNAFMNATAYSLIYARDGRNAFLDSAGDYFGNVEFLNCATSGKPVMQVSSDGNHWVNTGAAADGPWFTQWKTLLDGFSEGKGTFGNKERVKATVWIGGEGDTGQDEDDFYAALVYMYTGMRDYTNPDHKIFAVVPGRFTTSGFDNHQRQRNAILRVIDDLDFVYFGAEAFDLGLADQQHFTPEGQAILHARLAERVAAVLGKRSEVGTLGSIVTSATYSGSSVVATVALDGGSAISGSEVDQFRIEDDGTPVTISSINVSGTTITFTLSDPIATGSVVNLWCNYGRGAGVDPALLVKDVNGLPLRSVSELLVTET